MYHTKRIMDDIVYLTSTKKQLILGANDTDVVIISPVLEKVLLPVKPLNGHKITFYNHTGGSVQIDTNSSSDLFFSQFIAPSGKQLITLEDKRMVNMTYITVPTSRKIAFWHIRLG